MAAARFYSSNAGAMTLTTGINASVTSMIVNSTAGLPTSYPYTAVIDVGTSLEEIVNVTNAAGTTLTIARGQDGTSGQTHGAGATVRHMGTARDLREPQEHIGAVSAVHGITGSVVGTTDTQTLTGKTVTGGTVNPTTLQKGGVNVPTISEAAVITNKDMTSGTNTFPSALATDAEVTSAVSTHAALTTGTHGVGASTVVGTDLTQTLTAKTITGGTVNPTTLQKGSVNVPTISESATLTNKTIDGGSNTLANIPQSAVTSLSADQTTQNNRLTALEAPTWTAFPTFAGANPDGTVPPQYHADNGRIDLRGKFNHATTFPGSGTLLGTMPVGVRPNVTREFPVARSFTSSNTSDCRLEILSTGAVWLYTPASETTWFSLDGIYYFTS